MTWRRDPPPKAAWYTTDRDPALRRYYDGAGWSPPVHVDDFARLGPRVMLLLGEDQSVEWMPLTEPATDDDLARATSWGALPLCPCPNGDECVASAQGRARGYMSVISDVRCKVAARSPEALRYDAMERALRIIEKACDGNPLYEPLGKVAHDALNT